MENTVTFYQKCVKKLLEKYDGLHTEGSRVELIFDDERMRYLVMWVGWWKSKRIYQCAVHIDICDDMVVLQCNDTEDLIATELVVMGIPRDKIVFGFLPSEVQEDARAELPLYSEDIRSAYQESLPHANQVVPA